MSRRQDKKKLELWQERLGKNEDAWSRELEQMDEREQIYRGSHKLRPLTELDLARDGGPREATHVRNIVAENIESEISSSIPQPKVTARRKEDEGKARLIEDMIRDELNRLPMETINDLVERIVPIQGGALYLVEWDNTQSSHNTVGELTVSVVHPKQIVPQDGVYDGIEEMDYIILKIPQTKSYIQRRYGVSVEDEREEDPEIKDAEYGDTAEDMVTQYIAYYRNDAGGIGLFSWVNDQVLEDLEDYQARRLPRCTRCGALKPLRPGRRRKPRTLEEELAPVALTQMIAAGENRAYPAGLPLLADAQTEEREAPADACPYCGGTEWEEQEEEFEEIYAPITRSDGSVIPGASPMLDSNGLPYEEPTKIPFYKPDRYPLILQKNISVFGQLLGESDVDKIKDQQNTVNRLEMKLIDRIIKAGTRITLPPDSRVNIDPHDSEKLYLENIEDRQYIGVYDFTGDVSQELAYLSGVYEEARQILGITDSFQGRRDTTAESGKAKEFAAAQSAGRLESKRVMKDAAYADLFQMIFQYKLAYADEPRPITGTDERGKTTYETFNRYDFLEQDENGEWYWNDQFLFATDVAAPLANNREAMWENCTAHLQAGAYGDPRELDTLILYWTKLELLHYPGAADTRAYLERKQQAQQEAAQQQMQQQIPAGLMQEIDRRARQDAMAAAGRQAQPMA